MIDLESVRMFCKKKNTTIKQMEKDLGIGNGVIAKWAKRNTDPSYERIVQIARYLNCAPSEITFGDKQPSETEGLSETAIEIARLVNRFPPESQVNVLHRLQDLARALEALDDIPKSE